MFTNSIDYTVCSTDPKHYNRICCNLTAPITKYSALLVSSLTANCCIVVLNEDDYIEIDGRDGVLDSSSAGGVKYSFKEDYSNLNPNTFSALLNILFENNQTLLKSQIDSAGRLVIYYNKPFTINSMTYNFKLITGFYNVELPLEAEYDPKTQKYFIRAESIGFSLSTPILYLTSNVAAQSYRNLNERDCVGSKIVMRLNNSFSYGMPIFVSNADFETRMLSNDLASMEFRLVDANMQEIQLLSPLYLCIHVRGIPDSDILGGAFDAVGREAGK